MNTSAPMWVVAPPNSGSTLPSARPSQKTPPQGKPSGPHPSCSGMLRA
ncbi:hypothetical protein [Nannocystis pusilla]